MNEYIKEYFLRHSIYCGLCGSKMFLKDSFKLEMPDDKSVLIDGQCIDRLGDGGHLEGDEPWYEHKIKVLRILGWM